MQCANCHRDFKEDEKEKGFYTQQNDHFMKGYRQFGYVCAFCGFHNTIVSIPLRVPFVRTGRTYEKLEAMIEQFKQGLEEFYKERSKIKQQHSLFPNEDE